MNKPFLILLCLFNLYSYGQNRFFYHLNIKYNTGDKKYNMILDVEKEKTSFYNEKFMLHKEFRHLPQSLQEVSRANDTFQNYYSIPEYDVVFSVNSSEQIDWKPSSDKKTLNGYTLQKANATFGEREWTAWFCQDIPIPEGPYKFRGLPGLIFEVSDNEQLFHYQLYEIGKGDFFDLKKYFGKTLVETSLQKFHKMYVDFFNNPQSKRMNILKNGGEIVEDDKPLTLKDLMEQNKYIQESIKKNYIPVQKDIAIPFP